MEHVLPRTDRKQSSQARLLYGLAGGALVTYGLKRGSLFGAVAALIGSDFVTHGATGHHLHEFLGAVNDTGPHGASRIPHQIGIQVQRSILVNATPEEAYRFMRNLENLPRFMQHLDHVRVTEEKRSHWVVRGPGGTNIEWDAELISDDPGQMLSWRSLDHPDVKSAGSVHFAKAMGDRGTIIRVRMQYLPIGGALAAVIAKLFGEDPDQQLKEDLHRLKQILETGEIATTQGQPVGGRRGMLAETHERLSKARVKERGRAAVAS